MCRQVEPASDPREVLQPSILKGGRRLKEALVAPAIRAPPLLRETSGGRVQTALLASERFDGVERRCPGRGVDAGGKANCGRYSKGQCSDTPR